MSMGPMSGILASAAGSSLAKRTSDSDRIQQQNAAQQGSARAEQLASEAAGVGQTDGEDHDTQDRDADGRRLWELPPTPQENSEEEEKRDENPPPPDPNQRCGTILDLSG